MTSLLETPRKPFHEFINDLREHKSKRYINERLARVRDRKKGMRSRSSKEKSRSISERQFGELPLLIEDMEV